MNGKLLLVENERTAALSEAKMVERGGFTVETALSGEEALQKALSDPEIELVLMDVDLGGGMDGTEAARRILRRRELPIVFLSGHAEESYVERVKQITNYGYVLKSSGEFVLNESIQMALKLHRAHVALRRRSEQHRRALEQVRFQARLLKTVEEAVIATEPDGTIIYVNPYAESMYGWSRDEILHSNIMDITVPGQSAEQAREIMEHLSRGESWSGEFYVQKKTGERFIAHVTNSPIYDQEGSLIGIIGISYDITSYKQTEEALKESRDKYRRLYSAMNEGLMILEMVRDQRERAVDYRILEINPAGETILGRSSRELTEQPVSELTSTGEAPHLETFDRIAAEGEPQQFDSHYKAWDRYYSVSAFSPVPGMVAVLFSDITQRTRAKEALRSSEKRFRDLFNTIRDAIIIVNEQREITDCNPAFTELFGYNPEEVKGSTTRVLFENDEEYERLGQEMQKQEEHRNFIYTTRYITRRGRTFIGEKNVHYLRDEEGRITGFVGLIRDITQKHRAEERINNLLQEKQMLLREVHHRIKNDMASINSLLSLQASSLESTEAARALQTAEHRINIMRNLYQTLFTNESFQRLNIGGFLETIVESLQQSYAHYSHISLDTDFQDLEVEARLAFPAGIIVNELITNAFKYAFEEDNGGTIRARVRQLEEDRLEIQVHDNGKGLPKEVAEEENYGFGLTLVEAFTRQHSGELSIERDGGTLIRSVLKIE